MTLKNILLASLIVLCTTVGIFSACTSAGLTEEEKSQQPMVTNITNVQPNTNPALIADIPESELPDELVEAFPEGTNLVIVPRSTLVDQTKAVSIETPGDNPWAIVDAGISIAKGFFPALAAWEGVLTLLSRRKRQLWGTVVTALNPFVENSVAVGEAFQGVTAAIGVSHSTVKGEAALEAELSK